VVAVILAGRYRIDRKGIECVIAAKGSVNTLVHDVVRLIAGIIIVLILEIAYAITYFCSVDHIFAILVMGGAAALEFAVAVYLLRRS
jgi:hypothetical protein